MSRNENYGGNGKQGGGILGGLVVIMVVAMLVFGGIGIVGMLADKDSSADNGYSNGGTTIIYQNPTNTTQVQTEKEEITTPIRTKYSCQGNYYSVFTNKQNVVDNFGTRYETANEAFVSINAGTKKLTYMVNGEYKYLRGTIYLSEVNKDNINYFRVYIYDENNNLIYQSADITDKNLGPLSINCNITGLNRVTIELEGCTTTCSGIRVIMPEEGFVFVQ